MSAQDKSIGNSNRVTNTNEKGRLSQAEIDHLVQEAEKKFKAEDEHNKQKIEAKSGLENYCLTIYVILNDVKIRGAKGRQSVKWAMPVMMGRTAAVIQHCGAGAHVVRS